MSRRPSTLVPRWAICLTMGACGDSDGGGGETTGAESTSVGSATAPATSEGPGTEVSSATSVDDSSGGSGGPLPEPGEVIDSEVFSNIGTSAQVSDLRAGPDGVFVVVRARIDQTFRWHLHRLNGGTWPAPVTSFIAFEAGGAIITAGRVTFMDDFGGGPIESDGSGDLAVVKRDPNGAHIYTQVFPADGAQDALGADVDAAGNVVVVGTFEGTVDFGGTVLVATGERDRFHVRLDPRGDPIDAVAFSATASDNDFAVVADADGHVVAGRVFDSVDFAGTSVMSSEPGLGDLFLAKFGAAGGLSWTRVVEIPGGDRLRGFERDRNGDLLILGVSESDVDLGAGPTAPAGGFLARFSDAGEPLGAFAVDPLTDVDVAVGPQSELAFAGTFGTYNAERWDADGSVAWQTEMNGTAGSLVTFSPSGNIVVAGTSTAGQGGDFSIIVNTLAY